MTKCRVKSSICRKFLPRKHPGVNQIKTTRKTFLDKKLFIAPQIFKIGILTKILTFDKISIVFIMKPWWSCHPKTFHVYKHKIRSLITILTFHQNYDFLFLLTDHLSVKINSNIVLIVLFFIKLAYKFSKLLTRQRIPNFLL